jgi:lysozyme
MDTQALKAQLVLDEGLRLKPYKDTMGLTTIGVGRNLDGIGISKDEAMDMLANDIDRVVTQLDNLFPWWKQMSDKRMQVLANLCFNIGVTKLAQFKNTLAAMQAGRYSDAADGMLSSLWANQVGARAQRLANMMREG